MSGFRKPDLPREQLVLWSQRLDDALPDDHPVRHLDLMLRSQPFAGTFSEWEQDYVLIEGKPPYHPRDLAGLYVYGMMNGVRSSRQLERACWNRLDVIWLMSNQHPDHSTIADFVAKHGRRLRAIFKDVVRVGQKAGLVTLEHVCIDGSKIEANAGKSSVRKQATIAAQLQQIDERIAALEAEWKANESREATLWGEQTPWCPPRQDSPNKRQRSLERKRKLLEAALQEIQQRDQESQTAVQPIASITDPTSRIMPDKEGRRKPNYNVQLAVDATAHFIVAQDVNDQPEDSGQLVPMTEQVKDNCGSLPKEASADSQYNTGPDLADMEELGVTTFLPDTNRRMVATSDDPTAQALNAVKCGQVLTDEQWAALPRTRGLISGQAFTYDADQETYRCPMGHTLVYVRSGSNKTKQGRVHKKQYGKCAACATCPKAAQCCQDPAKGRTVTRDEYEPCRERLRTRMGQEYGRRQYALRGHTVEPCFGYVKSGLSVRRFLRRGWEGVRTEWAMVCSAVNIGILLRHWDRVAPVLG